MANSIGSLEILDSIGLFEFAGPENLTLVFMRKILRFLAENLNQCNFGSFLP